VSYRILEGDVLDRLRELPEYAAMSRRRIEQDAPLFNEASA
jgi:hypothetical protein